MTDNADREVALITGASSGLGAEFARVLAARKYDLVVTARRKERLQSLKTELEAAHGVKVEIVAADLSLAAGVEALIAAVDALGRPVGVLINNAGFGLHGAFVEQEDARVMEMLQLDITSLTRLTHHYGRAMAARRRGRILQVSSVGAFQASPYYAAYSAAKAYVLLLSEGVHHELKGTGVTCTALCPGLTDTEFHEAANHPKTGIMTITTMSARAVATIGVNAMLRGRAVVITGFINKLNAFFIRLVPRRVATWVAGRLMKK